MGSKGKAPGGGEPPQVRCGWAEMKLKAQVTRRKLMVQTLKFSSNFFKRRWDEGAKPFPLSAESGIPLRQKAQEGRKKHPGDVSFVGSLAGVP